MTAAVQGLWGRLVAFGRRVLGWVTRAVTTVVTAATTLGHRVRDPVCQPWGETPRPIGECAC